MHATIEASTAANAQQSAHAGQVITRETTYIAASAVLIMNNTAAPDAATAEALETGAEPDAPPPMPSTLAAGPLVTELRSV